MGEIRKILVLNEEEWVFLEKELRSRAGVIRASMEAQLPFIRNDKRLRHELELIARILEKVKKDA